MRFPAVDMLAELDFPRLRAKIYTLAPRRSL